jgi:phospholipid/cholesterol/gamma-HCH transport system substrate-binding protein
MTNRREQVLVGLFVTLAVAVLVALAVSVSGAFDNPGNSYRAYFKFASGLAPAVAVRYGGLLAGKVENVRVDPQDSTRIEIEFRVRPEIPVKKDSIAKITALGALGENYLEITTGTRESPLAPPGSVLGSHEMLPISELGDLIGGLAPVAQQVLHSLSDRLDELKPTLAHVNELIGDKNRQNITASLENLNGMLADTRPKVSVTLANLQTASDRFPTVSKNIELVSERMLPLLDHLKGTIKQANTALASVDSVLAENRADIRASTAEVRKTLETAYKAVELLRASLDRNGDNLDESLANMKAASVNLKEMTETLKRKPSVLIRGENGQDRQPGRTK